MTTVYEGKEALRAIRLDETAFRRHDHNSDNPGFAVRALRVANGQVARATAQCATKGICSGLEAWLPAGSPQLPGRLADAVKPVMSGLTEAICDVFVKPTVEAAAMSFGVPPGLATMAAEKGVEVSIEKTLETYVKRVEKLGWRADVLLSCTEPDPSGLVESSSLRELLKPKVEDALKNSINSGIETFEDKLMAKVGEPTDGKRLTQDPRMKGLWELAKDKHDDPVKPVLEYGKPTGSERPMLDPHRSILSSSTEKISSLDSAGRRLTDRISTSDPLDVAEDPGCFAKWLRARLSAQPRTDSVIFTSKDEVKSKREIAPRGIERLMPPNALGIRGILSGVKSAAPSTASNPIALDDPLPTDPSQQNLGAFLPTQNKK